MNRLTRAPFVAALFLCLCGNCFPNSVKAQASAAPTAPPTPPQAAQTTKPAWAAVIPSYVLAPIRIVEGIGGPAVKVRLENKTDAYFVLDTGSDSCAISSAMAHTLGLTPQLHKGNAPKPYNYVQIQHFQFGNLDFHGPFMILDNEKGKVDGQPVEGILGTNLFSHFAVVFDFEQNQVILIPGGKLSDTQRAALGFTNIARVSGTTIETDSRRLFTPLSITLSSRDSVKEKVLVDTGRYHTIVANPAKMRDKPLFELGMRGVKGDIRFSVVKAQSAQVGDAKREPFFVGITSNPKEDVTIGMDFLSRFRVLMDFPAGEMYLAPVASRAPFPTLAARINGTKRIGMVVYEPTEQGEWRVKRVDALAEGGEAELKAGDIVREINGRRTDGLLTDELISLFKKDNVFKLTLLRDAKVVSVTIKVN